MSEANTTSSLNNDSEPLLASPPAAAAAAAARRTRQRSQTTAVRPTNYPRAASLHDGQSPKSGADVERPVVRARSNSVQGIYSPSANESTPLQPRRVRRDLYASAAAYLAAPATNATTVRADRAVVLQRLFGDNADLIMASRKQSTARGASEDNLDEITEDEAKEVRAAAPAKTSKKTSYRSAHHFKEAELQAMAKFESVEYWAPVTDLFVEHQAEEDSRSRKLKGIIIVVIGLIVGLWSVLLFHTLEELGRIRSKALLSALTRSLAEGYGVMIGWGVAASAFSALCCLVFPKAGGSGVPDVMAFLNGVQTEGTFNLRVLVMKTLSCIGAVTSGLPVGAEGPMIHIGALIGGGVGSGHSRTLNMGHGAVRGLFRSFQNAKDRRDFISTGAAAGVTSVFGSPLGGLLFVMEEVASFFPQRLAWKTFIACLVTFCLQQLVNSQLDGWQPRHRGDAAPLTVLESVAALFNTRQVPEQIVPADIRSLIPAFTIGIASAVVATFFIKGHLFIAARWRARYIKKNKYLSALEPIVVTAIIISIWFAVPMAFECQRIPQTFYQTERDDLVDLKLATQVCNGNGDYKADERYPTGEHVRRERATGIPFDAPHFYNPMATLTLFGSDNTIRLLFSRNTATEGFSEALFPPHVLVVFLLMYGVGAAYCVGMAISSGVVIPTIVIGSVVGRLTCGEYWNANDWANPGVAALIGATAFFSGLSRLTFSVVVIMAEISNDLSHVILTMIGAVTAKVISDRFSHSLYHEQLAQRCVPFLDFDSQVHKLDCFAAEDIMTRDPVCVPVVTTFREMINVLTNTGATHHGFPVLRNPSTGDRTFLGMIHRTDMERILWFVCLWAREREEGSLDDEPPLPTYLDLQDVDDTRFWMRLTGLPPELLKASQTSWRSGEDSKTHFFDGLMDRRLDLTPFVDLSAHFVVDSMCISQLYGLFRNLNQRHLCVVNRYNTLVGIITRRDLMGDAMDARCTEALRRQETVDAAAPETANLLSNSDSGGSRKKSAVVGQARTSKRRSVGDDAPTETDDDDDDDDEDLR